MPDVPENREGAAAIEASWLQLLDADALRLLLEQNPDLCRQIEDAIEQDGSHPAPRQTDQDDAATEATIDLRPSSPTGTRRGPQVSAPALGEFGDYELLAEIGRGGMGVVYRARQKSLNRIVALKMVLSGEFASTADLKRFKAEAHAAGNLNHTHIVPIYEIGEREGRHFFSMAYVEGPTLDHVLKMRPLAPETAAEIVKKIAEAVAYAHEHNIIHRDLKPANILLDPKGEPRIADFGLAKWSEGEGTDERTGDIVGTPSYMAPEQAAGRVNELTGAVDVYSLGAILYACLTGRPPFQAETKLDTILAVLESEATLPRQINRQTPRELEWIVLRCLEKRPENRYASAAELAEDLQRYLLGDPVEARNSGLWPRVRRWWRRQPTLVSHLAVIAIIVLVQHVLHFALAGDVGYLFNMTSLFAAWAVASVAYQKWMERPHWEDTARYCWAATDAALLTIALYLTGPPLDGLIIGYPLLVVAAGLFFRVRLVTFMLVACLVAYAALVYTVPEMAKAVYPPIYFALGLTALGAMVAYQVYRIRVLDSRYRPRGKI